jgi:DNA-binding MarR family transcriptional regulator
MLTEITTPSQIRILEAIAVTPSTIRNLCRELHLTDTTIRLHLSAMVESGFVNYRKDATGRVKIYGITQAGDRALHRAISAKIEARLELRLEEPPKRKTHIDPRAIDAAIKHLQFHGDSFGRDLLNAPYVTCVAIDYLLSEGVILKVGRCPARYTLALAMVG